MTRLPLLVSALLCAAGAFARAAAQKTPPASTQRETPAAAAPTGPKVLHPATAPAAPAAATVTPQAVRPPAASGGTFTAGLSMPLFAGGAAGAPFQYADRLTHRLDSTIVALVAVFRNTAGQPVVGATSPAMLSRRERERWTRCRDLYWDLTTYGAAVRSLEPALPANPSLQLAVAQLDTALTQNTAVAECDNVASMISAPERWSPWGDQYEASARHFYRDFYTQVYRVHERDRALVFALNAASATGEHLSMPAALPRTPPYAGAAPN